MTVPAELADLELLELSESVMSGAGYVVQKAGIEGAQVLLVENDDNIAVIAAPITLQHLLEIEPLVSRSLSERLVAGPPNRKRWDAFVVFLCAQEATTEETEPIADLVNNLRFARRLVRIGVAPTRAGVSRSLRPLLPLPTAHDKPLLDPLDELRRILVVDGLDVAVVQAAVDDFQVAVPSSETSYQNSVRDRTEMGDDE
ncbi:hypothetical protein [Nocardioides cavernaquae]|uniref:Uncharacterized protein n=1 Tax=Nocardioides cavernaquae TaxID=2321396 RepID=A0A3A5H9Y4_9ACTN|nr:hypothetical protein [Nocardioides cavernaquae]RJS47449.1 hypothetical protein D4739_15310 [Nocardioides cavernaquae]